MSHLRRPRIDRKTPAHVTVRLAIGHRLRNGRMHRALRDVFSAVNKRRTFRLCEYSIQSNHIHFVVEASSNRFLATGMQSLCIRIAQRLNRMLRRTGKVFSDRYHARLLQSPREVRNALAYVLNNARKHAAERKRSFEREWVDPYSSGPHFAGWTGIGWCPDILAIGPPVTTGARSWLLTKGWRRHGRIDVAEVPGSR